MLTKRLIDAAKYKGRDRTRHVVWDHEAKGLGLRIYPSIDSKPSRKTFVLSYRIGSRKRLLTLGDYGTLTLDQARQDARDRLREVKREGRDPLAEKRAGRAANSVTELIALYVERHAKATKRTWKEDERVLLKDVQPKIGHLKIGEVKRADIIDLLDKIADRAPISAARTFEIVRKMFNFAIVRGQLEQSPCHRVPSPAKAKQRARVLTSVEIRTLWDGLENDELKDLKGLPVGVGRPLRLAIRILLLTAQRRGELAKAEWRNLDLDKGLWVIPSEDAKNKREHRVPLSVDTRQAFKELQRLGIEREEKRAATHERQIPANFAPTFVLPNPSGTGPVRAHAITRAYVRICKALKLSGITVHDLRRSAATGLAEQKVPRLVIGKVLNHTDRGVTAVYERYEYADEMRAAIDKWARRVRKVLADAGPAAKKESDMKAVKRSGAALAPLAEDGQAIARQIEGDEPLAKLAEALSEEEFLDLLTQCVILAKVKDDLVSGASLAKFVTAAKQDRIRVVMAALQKTVIAEKSGLDTGKDLTGELLLADHDLKQAIQRQALGKYLDPTKISSKWAPGRSDAQTFNGWAVKLVAARLPADKRNQFAEISKLLKIAGITASRQTVNRILTQAKQ